MSCLNGAHGWVVIAPYNEQIAISESVVKFLAFALQFAFTTAIAAEVLLLQLFRTTPPSFDGKHASDANNMHWAVGDRRCAFQIKLTGVPVCARMVQLASIPCHLPWPTSKAKRCVSESIRYVLGDLICPEAFINAPRMLGRPRIAITRQCIGTTHLCRVYHQEHELCEPE